MTGKFIITRDRLAQLGACKSGMDFFDKTYPDGQAEYQDMLDKAVTGGHTDYATWLLDKIGPTEDILEVEEINEKELDIVFAGRIFIKLGVVVRRLIAGKGIEAGEGIEAGWGIEAYKGIKAGWGIEAGLGIEAGWGIKAGEGIEAGLGIEAGRGIEAGWGIEAGRGIEAGGEYGIYAGLRVKVTERVYRTIKAAEKPSNIMCGEWTEQ